MSSSSDTFFIKKMYKKVKDKIYLKRTIKKLRKLELFDDEWYLAQNPDVAASGVNAIEHYLLFGDKEGRSPNSNFSPEAYRREFGNLKEVSLVHYSNNIEAKQLIPAENPKEAEKLLSKPDDVLIAKIAKSYLFDAKWYIETYSDLNIDENEAARHYFYQGVKNNTNPHPLFSTSLYIEDHPECLSKKMNPLSHYIEYGEKQGYRIRFDDQIDTNIVLNDNEILSAKQKEDINFIGKSKWFNRNWYLNTYSQLNIPLELAAKHYYLFGVDQGLDPCSDFSTSFYIMNNRDLNSVILNPLIHYVKTGRSERRTVVPSKYSTITLSGRYADKRLRETFIDIADYKNDIDSNEGKILFNGDITTTCTLIGSDSETIDSSNEKITEHINLFNYFLNSSSKDDNLKICNGFVSLNTPYFDIEDIWFVNSSQIKFRVASKTTNDQSIQLTSYQLNKNSDKRIYKNHSRVVNSGESFWTVDLIEQYSPFIVFIKINNVVIDSIFIPFPSLLRGAEHFSELSLFGLKQGYVKALDIFSQQLTKKHLSSDYSNEALLCVSNTNIIGSEKLLQPIVTNWLETIFNIKLVTTLDTSNNQELDNKYHDYVKSLLTLVNDYSINNQSSYSANSLPTLCNLVERLTEKEIDPSFALLSENVTNSSASIARLASVDKASSANITELWPAYIIGEKLRHNEQSLLVPNYEKFLNVKQEVNTSYTLIINLESQNTNIENSFWQSISNQKYIDKAQLIIITEKSKVDYPLNISQNITVIKQSKEANLFDTYSRALKASVNDVIINISDYVQLYHSCSILHLLQIERNGLGLASCQLLNKIPHGKSFKITAVTNALAFRYFRNEFSPIDLANLEHLENDEIYNVPMLSHYFNLFNKQDAIDYFDRVCDEDFSTEVKSYANVFLDFSLSLTLKGKFNRFSTKLSAACRSIEQSYDVSLDEEQQLKILTHPSYIEFIRD